MSPKNCEGGTTAETWLSTYLWIDMKMLDCRPPSGAAKNSARFFLVFPACVARSHASSPTNLSITGLRSSIPASTAGKPAATAFCTYITCAPFASRSSTTKNSHKHETSPKQKATKTNNTPTTTTTKTTKATKKTCSDEARRVASSLV